MPVWMRAVAWVLGFCCAILAVLSIVERAVFSVGTSCKVVAGTRHEVSRGWNAVVVTDVDVLGLDRRSWIDRWWVDRQLKAYPRLASRRFDPHVFVNLGDALNEGFTRTTLDKEQRSDRSLKRFNEHVLSSLNKDTIKVVSKMGNHKAASPSITEKNESSFANVNGLIRHSNVEFVLVNELGLEECYQS